MHRHRLFLNYNVLEPGSPELFNIAARPRFYRPNGRLAKFRPSVILTIVKITNLARMALLPLFTFLLLCSCAGQKMQQYTFDALGTICSVDAPDGIDSAVLDRAAQIARDVEHSMSAQLPDSDLSLINAQASDHPVKTTPEILDLLGRFLGYSDVFNGLLDPAVLPLVRLWGIGTESARVPSQNEIDSVLPLVDKNGIVIKDGAVSFKKPGMGIDLGAIGKGWAADKMSDYLVSKGVKAAIISLGGNLALIGRKKDGTDWNVGIRDPYGRNGEYMCIVKVASGSVVTSGIYERYFEQDGKRYHHILDPRTGYPADNGLAGISIFTASSTTADAYSTGVFLLGLEKGMEFLESENLAEGLFITTDKKVYITSGLKGKVKITNDLYSFGN
jgi:thiamine biosynthesis lipoprotein